MNPILMLEMNDHVYLFSLEYSKDFNLDIYFVL